MAGTRTRDWAAVDFYRVLGVAPDATEDEIGRAFRGLAKQLHPDAGAPPADAERFKDVSAAYEVLGDARIRRDYDQVRREITVVSRAHVRAVSRSAPTGAFRAAKPSRGWTRSRAWLALVGGIAVTLLGIATAVWVWILRSRAGDTGTVDDPGRDITLAIVALKLLIGGPVFATIGALRLRRP
jgi:hypothetical protein